jgi:uncharacterized protein YndB with AHSA1/START domain
MTAFADIKAGTIHARIEIARPREQIFRALTTPSELAAWWGAPDHYRTFDWQIDLRVGGGWSCKAKSLVDDRATDVRGEFLEIEAPRLLVQTWEPSWESYARSTIRYELTPTETGTLVTVQHSGLATEQSRLGHSEGWKRVLGWMARGSTSRTPARPG